MLCFLWKHAETIIIQSVTIPISSQFIVNQKENKKEIKKLDSPNETYRRSNISFESKTSKNNRKIDVKRRPLLSFLFQWNLFNLSIRFRKTRNDRKYSISSSNNVNIISSRSSRNPNFFPIKLAGRSRNKFEMKISEAESTELKRRVVRLEGESSSHSWGLRRWAETVAICVILWKEKRGKREFCREFFDWLIVHGHVSGRERECLRKNEGHVAYD